MSLCVDQCCSMLLNVAQLAYVLLLLHIVAYDCVLFLLVFDMPLMAYCCYCLLHVVSKCALLLTIAANSCLLLHIVAYC